MEIKDLAATVDEFHAKRQARLEADKLAAALKKEESKFKALIIATLREQEVDVVGGKELTVTLVTKQKPTAADWEALYAYIKENDAFDLLHRRLTEKAVKERWGNDEVVPGVIEVDIDDLSLSTVRPT